jgi:DNA-binding NtrC family response regulator
MVFLNRAERNEANAFARIGYCNPFLPERLQLERQILGDRFRSGAAVIHYPSDFKAQSVFENFSLLLEQSRILADTMRQRVVAGKCKREEDQHLYRETVVFLLYGKHFSITEVPSMRRARGRTDELGESWSQFQKDYDWYLRLPELVLPAHFGAEHCFSIFFQIDRAFSHIFEYIVGSSMPIAKLRAAIWESIFTHDMGRYIRGVHKSMGDITTLITGKSGTGKELVARAIGLSRYQAFNPRTKKFEGAEKDPFFAVNLSALSSTLIESELFGHCKGSFTGAVKDRRGWLEVCGQNGTVFLDEIGELDLSIQVKLLRVLQTRTFSPVGETKPQRFLGKFVTATNRDLAAEISKGHFREDLYYRLCADMVHTPTLQEQLLDRPEDLLELTRYIARRLLVELPEEADTLASEAAQWIEQHFGTSYDWPGNIRELEQCVRNVMIRKSYTPSSRVVLQEPNAIPFQCMRGTDEFVRSLLAGEMTLDEMSEHYASLVYAQVGRYDLASQKLGIDWRTLKVKLKQDLIRKFGSSAESVGKNV